MTAKLRQLHVTQKNVHGHATPEIKIACNMCPRGKIGIVYQCLKH